MNTEYLPAFLPVIAFFLLTTIIKLAKRDLPARVLFIWSAVLWGSIVALITEWLSLFNMISFKYFFWVWGLIDITAVLACFTLLRYIKPKITFTVPHVKFSQLPAYLGILFIAMILTAIAVIAPPNTFDSMTYHMSRVAHWIQNGNVEFYPTSIVRQLYSSPWAEYAILHFQVLSGSDRFANFLQWFAMAGTLVVVSSIAGQLGVSPGRQVFAAIFTVTLPMGILQASSTQNDYVVSFWLACFVFLMLRLIKGPVDLWTSMLSGLSLGLCLLTKGTAYLYAIPFVIWYFAAGIKKNKFLISALIIFVCAVAVNWGFFSRNLATFGSPLGGIDADVKNRLITFSSIMSNVIRNVGLHCGTPVAEMNAFFTKGILWLHHVLRIDIEDLRTSSFLAKSTYSVFFAYNEDTSGNPLHFTVILLACGAVICRLRAISKTVLFYGSALFLCSILFCVCLKFQIWGSRLHLPLFVLAAPFVAAVLSGSKRLIVILSGIMMLFCLPWVFLNDTRPLIGAGNIFDTPRIDQYFKVAPKLKDPFRKGVAFLEEKGCFEWGLYTGGNNYEYPFWVLGRESIGRPFRIEHVRTPNILLREGRNSGSQGFCPRAIICLKPDEPESFVFREIKYVKKWEDFPVSIYMAER